MKYFLSVFVIFVFYACQADYTKNAVILHAESLLNSSPDSSYSLLCSIQHPEKMTKADYAAWCYNYTFSQYKLYKEITSDSLIQYSINYYSNNRNFKYSGTSWYLLGCIYRIQNKRKEAVLAFKKAEEILMSTNETDIKGLNYFNLGYVSMEDELYNLSLNYFKKSLKCFQQSRNIKYQAYAYREISNMYYQMRYPYNIILQNLNNALRLSEVAKDSVNYYDILVRKGKLMYDRDFKHSKEYILKGYNYFPNQRPYFAAYLAYVYSKLNKPDSAKYYLQISLKDTINSPYKIIGYLAAEIISQNENDYKNAYFYLNKAYLLRDSTFKKTIKSQIYRIDRQYNLNVKEKENAALQMTIRNIMILIAVLVIVILSIVFVASIILNRTKLSNAQNEMEKERLEHENEIYRTVNIQKQEIILLKLNQNIANTLKFYELKKSFKLTGKKEEFYEQLAKQSMLTEDVWKQYIDDVNYLFDNRISQLKEKYDLTKMDLIVIALMCLKVSLIDSCILLNMTRNTMYVRRKTIKKRLTLSIDIDLDQWINDTINMNKVIISKY